MAKQIKIKNAILCEYVARGAGNKHTLVNVFSGDLVVPEFPAHLNLGLYIELAAEGLDAHDLTVELHLASEPYVEVGVRLNKTPQTGGVAVIAVESLRAKIDRDLLLEGFILADGYRKTKFLSKKIYKAPALTG